MNISKNSEDSENIIILLNKLIDSFKKKNLKNLSELSNEKFLFSLLLEIEPNLEKIGGKIEINEDSSFGIRYANYVSIIRVIEIYLSKSPDKEKFSTHILDFKNLITINELLKKDKEQLITLAEILLFLVSISSKKDYYLDKLSDTDDIRYVNAFFYYIEKYIYLDNKLDETTNLNQSNLEKSFSGNTNLAKLNSEFLKERESLLRTLRENEKIISNLNDKNEILEKNYADLELKYKDKEREYELVKNSQNKNLKAQEEMFNDNFLNSDLKNQIAQKDLEINDLRRESDLNLKLSFEEIKKYKEKIESYEDRLSELKSLKAQNDKLNSKIKELLIVKERYNDYEDLKNTMDLKNKQIEKLLKEKTTFTNQIDKLNKEILTEKEKTRQAEYDRKKMDYDLNEIKKEMARVENVRNYHNMTNILQNNLQLNLNNISEVRRTPNLNNSEMQNDDVKLYDLGGDSMILDELKEMNSKNKNFTERDYQDLRNEKNELVKLYKSQVDEIHKLIDEKDRLLNTIDSFKLEIEKNNSEKERLGIEKEKLEIQTQKLDLDCQKLKIYIERYENEKKRMEDEMKDMTDKIENITNERNSKNKENESLKRLLNTNQALADKILVEKQNLIKDYQVLQYEIDKYKQPNESNNFGIGSKKPKVSPKNINNNTNNTSNSSNILISEMQTEINLLKNEIQTLKKEDIVKNLKHQLMKYDSMEQDKNPNEVSKRAEDLDFYKKSYEEQKNRVNKEHEMISSSLYELALQFMSLKGELQKKMTPENPNNGKK